MFAVRVSYYFECTTETAFILHRYVQEENNNDKYKALAGSLASAASSASAER